MLDALLLALNLDGRRLFLFLNGPLDTLVEHRICGLGNARVIRSTNNIGLGAGLNALVRAASEEGVQFLLIFDQDSAPAPELPAALTKRFCKLIEDGMRLAVIGPLLVSPTSENYLPVRYSWRNRSQGTVNFVPTSGSLISLEAWRATGPFRDDYFIGLLDVEWGFRAWSHGYASVVAEDVEMAHRWGTQATDEYNWRPQILRQSGARNYFYLRNAVDCWQLPFAPVRWKVRFIVTLAAQIVVLLTMSGSRTNLRVIGRAFNDGWHKRLGPLPPDFDPGQ